MSGFARRDISIRIEVQLNKQAEEELFSDLSLNMTITMFLFCFEDVSFKTSLNSWENGIVTEEPANGVMWHGFGILTAKNGRGRGVHFSKAHEHLLLSFCNHGRLLQ